MSGVVFGSAGLAAVGDRDGTLLATLCHALLPVHCAQLPPEARKPQAHCQVAFLSASWSSGCGLGVLGLAVPQSGLAVRSEAAFFFFGMT